MEGWVLDVYPDHERELMDVWMISRSGDRTMLPHPYRPVLKVAGGREELARLERQLAEDERIRSVERAFGPLDVNDRAGRDHLIVETAKYSEMTEAARRIEALGNYRDYTLYDVDLRLPTRYLFEKGVFPLAHVDVGSGFMVLSDPDWGASPLPPLKAAMLDVVPEPQGPVRKTTDPVRSVRVGDVELSGEKEDHMLLEAVRELKRLDPDIVVTFGGDSFVLPYIYERAAANELLDALVLDRSGRPFKAPERAGRSYFSYGQIYYKPPFYPLKGRVHLDMESSFMMREGGLIGLSLLSRMSLLPLQLMARLSPGSAISYMECVEALRRGRSVRWKKNIPEGWKSAVELSRSDRGGLIFDPLVGAYSDVLEMDFSSFYPHIMWKKNLSVETLQCDCCRPASPDAPNVAPGLGYHFCTKETGLIPSVVGEVLSRRMRYKESAAKGVSPGPFPEEGGLNCIRPPEGPERYLQASNALKWVLVTCFGYTGYKNARFGRIEVHESITAYARDLLLKAKELVESHGFSLLHGIVDSLWITGPRDRAKEVASAAERETGVPIGVDAVYKWIAFLPNKTNGAGALNRYYGVKEDGTMKFRGIECRQHSTPPFIKDAQESCLQALSGAASAGEVQDHMPGAFRVIRERGRELIERRVRPQDLAVTIKASRSLEEYSTASEHVSAMQLLKREGVDVQGGQKVRFVVLDHAAKRAEDRVCLLSEDMDDVRYDVGRYLRLSARAMYSALSVFGVAEEDVLRAMKGVEQKGLIDFE